MAGIENTLIARYDKNSNHFEILVDPKNGYDFKRGAKKDFANVLAFDEVFKDAKKGERHSPSVIQKEFGTTDVQQVAQKILREGELQLTTEQRRKAVAEKHAQLVALIAKNVMDPRTKTPHPPARIEAALEEARFQVDAFKKPEEELEAAIDAIREIIPVSTEHVKVAVRIPAPYAAKCYGMIKEFGIQKEEWANDGSLLVVVEMPAGVQGAFYDRLNNATAGNAETRRL
ncbi:ribosome assembly factor SBDS [Candidatus Micrarchaeota archaeon]|nr:ribosome assembly factor SBDS [Candidatus Micrarchaeota archaeon]